MCALKREHSSGYYAASPRWDQGSRPLFCQFPSPPPPSYLITLLTALSLSEVVLTFQGGSVLHPGLLRFSQHFLSIL